MGRKKNKKIEAKPENISHLTTDTLLSRMQEKIDCFEYEEAQKYCKEALKRSPDDITVLEAAGSLCLELGEEDRAKHCYGRAITLNPNEGYAKYFTMAQLLSNKESLQCYLTGIEILTKVINCKDKSVTISSEKDNHIPPKSLLRELSEAYCSVAELFMTELCDEDEAEAESLKNIEMAISTDSQNPEAYQQMASFLLVKQKPDEAKEFITKSLEMWLPHLKAIDEGSAQPGTFDPIDPCSLSYNSRLSTARILIEVGEVDSAGIVLDMLLLEDDQVADTWYLSGWNSYLQGDEHKGESKYYLRNVLKLKDDASFSPEMLRHTNELLDGLKDIAEEAPCEEVDSDSEEDTQMDVT